jgi:hypothetical protein
MTSRSILGSMDMAFIDVIVTALCARYPGLQIKIKV